MAGTDTPVPVRVRRALVRVRGVSGITIVQLRYTPVRTALSILAIALAVLAVTLLASTGVGVLETGNERFAEADRDLWVTGGPATLSAHGIENPIVDAHTMATALERRDDVTSAAPLAFHAVYLEPAGGDRTLVTGVGLPGTHSGLSLAAGDGFSQGDIHYANGTYDGPRTDEVIIDRATADAFGIKVGDTVTVAPSRESTGREVTVVGVSSTYTEFLGTATVTMPLSELQHLAGTTGSDRATFVTVALADDANPAEVSQDITAAYPEYEVRTNREQLMALLESRAVLIASATVLVSLAVLVGSAVMLNLLALAVIQRADTLAALTMVGVSRGTLVSIVLVQGILLGVGGGALGLAATPVLAALLDDMVTHLVGYTDVVRVTTDVYLLGGGVAATISVIGSFTVGWLLSSRVTPR